MIHFAESRARALAAASVVVAGCGGGTVDREPLAAPLRPVVEEAPKAPSAKNALASRPELSAELAAPSTAAWLQGAGGPGARRVRVTLTNTSERPAKVADLRVSFHTRRDGVSFVCAPHVGGAVKVTEPPELAPGQSFAYERDIDCTMPALGRYDVAVAARFGEGEEGHDDAIGTFTFEVTGAAPWAPRAFPNRPALQVALIGENETKALSPGAWKHGDHHVSLLFANVGAQPLALGAARVVLSITSKGAPFSCARDALTTKLDARSIAPGTSQTVPLPVRCPLDAKGDFELSARLALVDAPDKADKADKPDKPDKSVKGDTTDGPEVGRLRLHVRGEDEPPLPVNQLPVP